MLNFIKRSFFEAPIVKNNSFNSLLVERHPSKVLTVMGKKVINTVTTTLLQMEYPNQRIKIGARAMVGIIRETIISRNRRLVRLDYFDTSKRRVQFRVRSKYLNQLG